MQLEKESIDENDATYQKIEFLSSYLKNYPIEKISCVNEPGELFHVEDWQGEGIEGYFRVLELEGIISGQRYLVLDESP